MDNSEQGRKRKQTADDRINNYIATKLERRAKDRRQEVQEGTSSSSTDRNDGKRKLEETGEDNSKRLQVNPEVNPTGEKRKREDLDDEDHPSAMEDNRFIGISDMCVPEVKDIVK